MQPKIEALERILVFLSILEDRAKSATFDYSSTQLLATWLQDVIAGIPQLDQAAKSLAGLADSVEISTGRGQSEVWAMFRRDSDGQTDEELRKAVLRVRDPSKLYNCVLTMLTP
jgi:midasin